MTTKLQHSDAILSLPAGAWIMACEPIAAVDMRAGGRANYDAGARFRVKFTTGDLIWCHDEDARTVTFGREELWALEIMERKP